MDIRKAALLVGSLTTYLSLSDIASATLLYSDAGPYVMDHTDNGSNIPGMTLSRDVNASDTLYFRFTLSDLKANYTNENYYGGFNFYSAGQEKLAVGNGWNAWAYSAFNTVTGDFDLNSATPEPGHTYQYVRLTDITTIVFKVQFIPGGNDFVTAWLNPNLSLTEDAQLGNITTTFFADATFDEIHLRVGNADGNTWTYSNIAIADSGTSSGFFATPTPEPGVIVSLAGGVGILLGWRRTRR